MAHRALFHISLLLIISFAGCRHRDAVTIPGVYVKANNAALQQHEGFLSYQGKKFSGYTFELYASGDTALLFSYSKGKEEGWCRRWYEGKKKMEERFYVAGKKEGEHKGWWPNGMLRFDYLFRNDEHEGEAKEWFSNGKRASVFTYAKGHEAGLQRMWWEDGRVRANYVVKDGQQYGLIGRKLCKNADSTKQG